VGKGALRAVPTVRAGRVLLRIVLVGTSSGAHTRQMTLPTRFCDPGVRFTRQEILSCRVHCHPNPLEQTSLDVTVEAAMGPIGYAGDVSMFHRIKMNVVGVAFQVGVIANSVLPVTALPDALFTLDRFAGRSRGRRIKAAGEATFDQAPASREVCVPIRQRPERMKVIWQYADCNRLKWAAVSNQSIASSQAFDFIHQQVCLTVGDHDREKENASFDLGTAILRHGKSNFARAVRTAQECLRSCN
jgi:hypothetical protein